jgi:hypothetical protein
MSIAPAVVPRDVLTVTRTSRAVRWWVPLVAVALVAVVTARGLLAGVGVVEQAGVWAGSTSWTAWFFGTVDPAAATAVGAPAALWIPALVARFTGWEGVAVPLTVLAVAVGAVAVRRVAGRGAGLAAAAVLAVTLPVDCAHAVPALFLALAGWALTRRRFATAGLALGLVVLAAGFAGLGAVVVAVLTVRRLGGALRLLAGTVTVVAAWGVVAWGWPGAHPVVTWRGAVGGVAVPVLVALGVCAAQAVWTRFPSRPVRVTLVAATTLAALVWLPGAASTASAEPEVASLLAGSGTTWSAAVAGTEQAAGLELASGTSVLAADDLTLAAFQSYVATGRVRYVVSDGMPAESLSWVAQEHEATSVGGRTVYDLAG